MAKQEKDNRTDEITFEQAINDLKEIVDKIEQGQIPLQESIDQYEKGMGLIRHCRGILQEAEKRIDKMSLDENGPVEA